MVVSRRFWSVPAALGLVVLAPAAAASAQEADPGGGCAATGYVVSSDSEMSALQARLVEETVHLVDGVPLDQVATWVVPDGGTPVVVIDSAEPLSSGQVSVTLAGRTYPVATDAFPQAQDRYVTNVPLPHLGARVRTLGLTVASGPCRVSVTLMVDRPGWSTVAGGVGAGLAMLCGSLLILVARLRKGGWLRRFLLAAPLGLVAGLGYAVVRYESGVRGPFEPFPWWWPAAGLALAGLLPLTRRRRQRPAADATSEWRPPVHAALGGWRPVAGFTRTGATEVHRAVAGEDADRALIKVAVPDRAGDPEVRLRLEREARVLSDIVHPNLVRLRETIAGEGAPTLVFDDVDGSPLPAALSGPQAVTAVLAVLAGLAAVHERALVHRDVRPENVWLDRTGQALLAGFELACAGVAHPLEPEPGVAPYGSPEQRAGQVLDGRADLYSCAAMLQQLLPAPVPEPVAELIRQGLAEDRAARPPSADQFAAELRRATEASYGPDWAGRGALAAAVTAHAAVVAAATGYAVGAGTGSTAAGLGAAADGSAGVGATAGGSAGVGAVGPTAPADSSAEPAEVGTVSAAEPVTPATAGTPSAGTVAGATAGSSGKVAVLVNTGVAVAAGAAVAVSLVLVDAEPVRAREPVITAEQARVIVIRTVAEGVSEDFDHFADEAETYFAAIMAFDDSIAGGELVEVVVGVPPDQYAFPAWFVASAQLRYADGVVSMFARFGRAARDQPWRMVTLVASNTRLLPAPLLEDDWLAPLPAAGDMLVDPAGLPGRYADWFLRAEETGEVTDDVLALRYEEIGMVYRVANFPLFYQGDRPERVMTEWEISVGYVDTDPIPLADGTVWVTFPATVSVWTRFRPEFRSGACDGYHMFWQALPGQDLIDARAEFIGPVEAWVPVPALVPEPEPAPSPEPDDPERDQDDQDNEPELEPVDPETVLIEDWQLNAENERGQRC